MAIFGRRQPHAPIILRPTVLGAAASTAPIGQIVQLTRAAQAAALAMRPKKGTFTVKTPGPPVSVARLTQISRIAQQAATTARAPRGSFTVKTPGPPASVSRLIQRSQAVAAAITARSPRGAVILKTAGPSPAVASPNILRGLSQSQAAALAARQPRIFKPFIGHLGAPQAIGRLVTPRGQLEVQAATNAQHRPFHYKPLILGLMTFTAPVVSRMASPVILRGLSQSEVAALRARRPYIFKPLIRTLIRYSAAVFNPPVAALPIIRGRFAAQQAATEGRLTRPHGIVVPFPPQPGPLLARNLPFFARVPDPNAADFQRRLARLTEKLHSMLNSLIGQGMLVQEGPATWKVMASGTMSGSGITGTFP